jgi:CRP-like cAMP-binding protein
VSAPDDLARRLCYSCTEILMEAALASTPADIARALAAAGVFAHLDGDSRNALGRRPLVHLAAGGQLFQAGDKTDSAFVVIEGDISIDIATEAGRAISVAQARQGDLIGELALFDGRARSASARALTAARLLPVPRAVFERLLADNPRFARAIIADLAAKLRATNQQVENISFRPLAERVAALLAALVAGRGPPPVVLVLTQAEVAQRLGASREKVNAHLQDLKAAGAITLGRGRITCIDPARLARAAREAKA